MRTMKRTARGQASPKTAVAIVVVLSITAILGAFLMPVAINELEANETVTINQSVSSTEDVNSQLNTTLDSIGTSDPTDNATYTLQTSNQSVTNTIENGSSATFSFDEGDVNVTLNDVDSGTNSAEASYEYPTDFGYSDGASALWGLLGLALVLGLFLMTLNLAKTRF